MKLVTFSLLLFVFLLPCFAFAQMEAAVWPIGSGKQLNFQSGNFEYSDFNGNSGVNSTICDEDGNLFLYSNGNTVWNAKHEILINGTSLVEDNRTIKSRPFFIPYPQKDRWYILFYETVKEVASYLIMKLQN